MRKIKNLGTLAAAGLLLLLCVVGCGGTGNGNAPHPTASPRSWDTTPRPAAAAPPTTKAASSTAKGRGPYPGPLFSEVAQEPVIRVRVQTRTPSLQVIAESSTAAAGQVRVSGPPNSGAKVHRYATPMNVTRVDGAWVLRDANGQGVSWRLPTLLIEADGGGTLQLGEKHYPRRLVLTPKTNQAGVETAAFDVVNHVPLETYLPGVLERELYANWPLETFKTQAVAARSYALWEKTIASGRHYDLESTTASQVYGGKASNPTALQAVKLTRGQVVAYGGRVLPAFFASSTGGLGQDATTAFPNRVRDLPPLRAREHGAWDKNSPRYRWGPTVRHTNTLAQRVAAWGKRKSHPVQQLAQLQRIEVSARNRVGRPTQFTLTDAAGKQFNLTCEHFRNACNFTQNGKIPLNRKLKLFSSHVDVAVAGGETRFTNGRGHGHGVGLSQWGAQAMAEAGHSYTAILSFYYPGAEIVTLYR